MSAELLGNQQGGHGQRRLFLSYGRRDCAPLANRLTSDLKGQGFDVWQDTREIKAGQAWEQEIRDGLRSTQIVVVLLSPHAVRMRNPNEPSIYRRPSNDTFWLDADASKRLVDRISLGT